MATSADRPLARTDVLSTSEVADLLGIPRSTVHELARRGDLPARRVGRRWIFLRDRLAAAITPLDDPAAWRPENDARDPLSATPQRYSATAAGTPPTTPQQRNPCLSRDSYERERRDSNPRPPA
jgi:excisionase family DNA binding protein